MWVKLTSRVCRAAYTERAAKGTHLKEPQSLHPSGRAGPAQLGFSSPTSEPGIFVRAASLIQPAENPLGMGRGREEGEAGELLAQQHR